MSLPFKMFSIENTEVLWLQFETYIARLYVDETKAHIERLSSDESMIETFGQAFSNYKAKK